METLLFILGLLAVAGGVVLAVRGQVVAGVVVLVVGLLVLFGVPALDLDLGRGRD